MSQESFATYLTSSASTSKSHTYCSYHIPNLHIYKSTVNLFTFLIVASFKEYDLLNSVVHEPHENHHVWGLTLTW